MNTYVESTLIDISDLRQQKEFCLKTIGDLKSSLQEREKRLAHLEAKERETQEALEIYCRAKGFVVPAIEVTLYNGACCAI